MDKQQKEKNALIELFRIHFETYYHLPPCASRILGVLILNCNTKGMTFEELVELGNASKSSISTSIKLLLKLEKINYYTIEGDRKKYFRSAAPSVRILKQIRFIDSERYMVEKVKNYETKYSLDNEYTKNRVKALTTYMKYLIEFEDLLNRFIKEKDFNEKKF